MLKRGLLWLLLGVLVASGFAALGRWQLRRAEFKEAAQVQAASILAQREVVDLAKVSQSASSALRWVKGAGYFRAAPTLLLDNQRRGDQVGVRVYRVFVPLGGKPLLVDLGWQAWSTDRTLPKFAAPSAQLQTVQGLYAPPPSAGLALGPDHVAINPETWLLTRIQMSELSAALAQPLARNVVRLDPALPGGYARDLNLLANTLSPEKHRGYAVQWFGLALTSLVVTLLLLMRKSAHV